MSGSSKYTTLSRAFVAPLARMIWRPRIIGRKNIPKRGPVILASNHRSFIDSPTIGLLAPRKVFFLAKKEYFTGKGFRGSVTRGFFEGIGAIGVERGAGSAAQEALDLGLERLRAGDAFAIYPEGTRSLDGRLYRGRTGVAWLALTSGAPVVPVALTGTQDVQPVGSRVPKLAKVTVEFGTPLDLSGFGEASSGRARRHATDAVMAAIQELSGQEPANAYNNPPATIVERVRQVLRRDDPTAAVEPD
ncbi:MULTISPECIES: 1-acyl-sn-glycerol-3-phosphate acyltransferase [unclassified Curtobacterium]|uniref:lysophospholipid acyltransferase family protein n=2 Tax=Curtobacterium TaxID=2034 RepID=UPI00089E0030|nr:1-acyl-sn-glycerol-3-phosphate acyltransferase [Curtobacterium sp. BH-2-1-1]OII18806.1 acyl-phosphate glycerol 3-phosphate acyltransferase [Curtobacterium sp. MCBA15_013]OII24183.1 acyl-phosphate glycerol 3-phosphate acyltransferase [Curtobacterium sp. MCBA15_016]SFF42322.1 1-acyl-sn-glycerol-3-phosphate acyltransferase [Curtobacterium sp. YR515]